MAELGQKVKDIVTGLEGIVVGKTEWLNGCVRFAIQSRVNDKGGIPEQQWIDEQQAEIIDSNHILQSKKKEVLTGGPRKEGKLCNDPNF